MLTFLPPVQRIFFPVLLLFVAHAAAQSPVVSSFSPASGNVGASVSITGNNFNSVAENNVVFFGAVRAKVTSATTTALTVTVPGGSSFKPISVLNTATRLTGYSA